MSEKQKSLADEDWERALLQVNPGQKVHGGELAHSLAIHPHEDEAKVSTIAALSALVALLSHRSSILTKRPSHLTPHERSEIYRDTSLSGVGAADVAKKSSEEEE